MLVVCLYSRAFREEPPEICLCHWWMLRIIVVDIRTCPLRPLLILSLVWWWRCCHVVSIVRWQAEVSWKVSVLCAECSSVLRIVQLRPPILSNHRFEDEVQGSSKPLKARFHFNRWDTLGKGKFQAPTQNQFLEEREIVARYVLYMLINIRFFVE